ncbi:GIY-YIG nuclease family protein [Muricauda sp. SCSIO 64092]|uniref:GIY-YIG nuclease family protein n=1 Tax=Allomuricauda sp. SCSIO 64092 TaxID=2908842 RepID=UPI001FF3E7EB|nr:GIY-YIG nuclease family protein [Muricauda sp. SCSIO 64092]UOY06422.1 GIY-YIG nuclease family protein [Muricauda sp. SCSIO 64092]
MKLFFVYILECSDNTFYTGITSDLQGRLQAHQMGKHRDSYTFSRRPVSLVFFCEFTEASKAIEVEKQIKRWSRAKKKAMISGDFEQLPNLAKKKFKKEN